MRIRILDRYLLSELLMPLAVCLGGFMLFYISFDLIGSLNRFQEHHLNVGDVFRLYLVKTPEILVFILPIVLLLSMLYSLTNHTRHNELVAMRAAGVSLWRISFVYLAVGLIFSLVLLFMNEAWVPKSKSRQDAIMRSHDPARSKIDLNIQPNFFYPSPVDQRKWVVGVCDLGSEVLYHPQVYWRENGFDWHLIANRAESVNGRWTFYGLTSVTTNDISNLHDLVVELKKSDSNFARFIREAVQPETLAMMNKYSGGENPELRRMLADELNHLIRHELLYESHRFYGVKLSPETVDLMTLKPGGTDLIELNLMLLNDALPTELSRKAAFGVIVYRGDYTRKLEMTPFLYTNRIVMPQFTETFGNFQTEVQFDNHFLDFKGTEPVEVPILDLLSYIRAHPDLRTRDKAMLKTQLHGRIAMPWTCIVVVLIAIPFGALGGRRNIFMGVAGSILICFVYFVLLKTSLAMGTAGIMPGWMAAWLPNGFFGLLGYSLISKV